MVNIFDQIIEELMQHFGRTGSKKRPRIRKFHAELLLSKYQIKEKVINRTEINRPKEYINRMVKFSKGFLKFINEGELEIEITEVFFNAMNKWHKQYSNNVELDENEENLLDQGIIINEDNITFNGKLSYSRFYKIVSDEGESINDPKLWTFSKKDIKVLESIDFSKKDSPIFSSDLFVLKFYVLRKIDEVAFVTSRFVHCPACNANYVVPASKIDFIQTYRCERKIGDKECKTTLKKFPARKMIPTYIYEVAIEVRNKDSVEYKEFFLESFIELNPGFYSGMLFGRTESKTNSFYFTCLTAQEEKSKDQFELLVDKEKHNFFNIVESITKHIKKTGFVIDEEKAKLPFYIETLKKLILISNKEVNLDHSLYFGAPGIGKTYALTMLHHVFYSNSGLISGPRFSLPGLTGGQKEVYYQDTAKRKNVPGLFSMQAFIFDEINNATFLADDKATNLCKSAMLASSGNSATIGGKEFPRTSLIAGTANYDVNYLRYYENKVKKLYLRENKTESTQHKEQLSFLDQLAEASKDIDQNFDYYAKIKDYGPEVPKALRVAVLKVRDEPLNYLTNFPKPLMERFYWSILVHPKYDKAFMRQKEIDVQAHLQSRKSLYSQRELLAQLFISEFDEVINYMSKDAKEIFEDKAIETKWSNQVKRFLNLLSNKYVEFFSMFHRISQVHVYALYSLTIINEETELSFATKRVFEKLISLLHNPISIEDFHNPDFDVFKYIGESAGELLQLIKKYPREDIRNFVDYENREIVRKNLVVLQNNNKIEKVDEYKYKLSEGKFEEIKNAGK